GMTGREWTEQTFRMSSMGGSEVLLAVAVEDRVYYLGETTALDDSTVRRVEDEAVRPALSNDDRAGAAVAAAEESRRGGGGGTATFVVGLLVIGLLFIGVVAFVRLLTMRHRGDAGPR